MQNNFSQTKKTVVCGMLLAIAIVVGKLKIVIPGLFRIVFNGPFYKFAAILFGPLYGAIVTGLTETIGVLLTPVGNYIWMFSVIACLKGFLVGLLWKVFGERLFCDNGNKKYIWALLTSVALPDYLSSFLCTVVMKYYFLWPRKTFFLMLAVRLLKETILIIFNVFVLIKMLAAYKKIICKGDVQNEF